MVQRTVQRAVSTLVLGEQRQLHRRQCRAVRAQQRVGQFEERIRSRGQTPVEGRPKA